MCGLAVFYRSSSEDTLWVGAVGLGWAWEAGLRVRRAQTPLGLNGHIGFVHMLSLEKEKGFSAKMYCPYTHSSPIADSELNSSLNLSTQSPKGLLEKCPHFKQKAITRAAKILLLLLWC